MAVRFGRVRPIRSSRAHDLARGAAAPNTRNLSPRRAVKLAVLGGLGQVRRADVRAIGRVGEGAGRFQDAGVGAGAQSEPPGDPPRQRDPVRLAARLERNTLYLQPSGFDGDNVRLDFAVHRPAPEALGDCFRGDVGRCAELRRVARFDLVP
jgi:hypothetical protein